MAVRHGDGESDDYDSARRRYSEGISVRSTGGKTQDWALLSLWMRELATGEYASLADVLDEVGRKAKARGLTAEMLDSLLKGA